VARSPAGSRWVALAGRFVPVDSGRGPAGLADCLGTSAPALSRALRRLEARKLLDVRRSAGGRATHIALTADGERVLTVSRDTETVNSEK
jgi:DNA-binding MarR family transcriptional regulator